MIVLIACASASASMAGDGEGGILDIVGGGVMLVLIVVRVFSRKMRGDVRVRCEANENERLLGNLCSPRTICTNSFSLALF